MARSVTKDMTNKETRLEISHNKTGKLVSMMYCIVNLFTSSFREKISQSKLRKGFMLNSFWDHPRLDRTSLFSNLPQITSQHRKNVKRSNLRKQFD